MSELRSVVYYDNEILKTEDLSFDASSAIDNMAVFLRQCFGPFSNMVIFQGLTVQERAAPSMNVDVASGFALDVSLETLIYNSALSGPVAIATADSVDTRIDIIEMRQVEVSYDTQQRSFRDPVYPNPISYSNVATKKQFVAEFQAKAGTPGSGVAPSVDSGWVKLAEVVVGAGVTTITDADIVNCTAGKDGEESTSWTTEKASTFVWSGSKMFSSEATSNVAVGHNALSSNTSGIGNVCIGLNALHANTTGSNNVAVGVDALESNTTGSNNVAMGTSALAANTTGVQNIAIGVNALAANTTGGQNIAIGHNALAANIGGGSNVAIGPYALDDNTTGNDNIGIGLNALTNNTIGYRNIAIGPIALQANTVGYYNVAVGFNALMVNTTGYSNVAMGASALDTNTVGYSNTAVGANALGGNTTGIHNTAVGTNALSSVTTGQNLTAIGYNAQASSATASNEVTLGDGNVATLRCKVTTITAISDERDKADIAPFVLGLDLLRDVQPKMYRWDMREWYENGIRDGSKKTEQYSIGFIAQDFKALQEKHQGADDLRLVYESNPDRLEANPGNLLPVLVNAIKTLDERISALESK